MGAAEAPVRVHMYTGHGPASRVTISQPTGSQFSCFHIFLSKINRQSAYARSFKKSIVERHKYYIDNSKFGRVAALFKLSFPNQEDVWCPCTVFVLKYVQPLSQECGGVTSCLTSPGGGWAQALEDQGGGWVVQLPGPLAPKTWEDQP